MNRSAPTDASRLGVTDRLERWWFPSIAPERLALCRILIGVWSLWYLWNRLGLYERIVSGDVDDFEPVGVARLLHGVPIEPSTFMVLMWITLALNVLFVLGAAFRITGPAFAAMLLWLLCYRNSWAMIYHTDNLLVLHAIVMAAAPSARVLSIDAILRRRPPKLPATPHPAYGWPIMLMCAVIAAAYLLAGLAKVFGDTGLGWVNGEVLRMQIVRDGIRKELFEHGAPAVVPWLCENVWLLTIFAFGSLLLELLAPLALIHRRAGWVWCLLVFPMHWGIFIVMGIIFRYQMYGFMFLPFLPVERLAPLVRALVARGGGIEPRASVAEAGSG